MFPTKYEEIIDLINQYDPSRYTATRNYLDGAVSRLSPYISRGVISTRMIVESLAERGHNLKKNEKFIQELAWRDYWQRVWQVKDINQPIRQEQPYYDHKLMPNAVVNANTGIEALDQGIFHLYKTGYIHNHMRMYLAMLTCNIGLSHWKPPARWMYYHLLDGDWASNALSWQWVCGANASKLYLANQENINKYCSSQQRETFLDTSYENLMKYGAPDILVETKMIDLKCQLPEKSAIEINPHIPTLIYNYYNLDPKWRNDLNANRILLVEPSIFEQYPISDKSMQFMLDLSQNIDNVQIFVGEFADLKTHLTPNQEIYYKEHPLNYYEGIEDSRDWMSNVSGYFSSFFGFWKKAKKEILN